MAPLRIHPRHDMLDGAVFPGRIHGLENQQQPPLILGVELLLQLGEPCDALLQKRTGLLLILGAQCASISRIDIPNPEALAIGNAIGLNKIFETDFRHGMSPTLQTQFCRRYREGVSSRRPSWSSFSR